MHLLGNTALLSNTRVILTLFTIWSPQNAQTFAYVAKVMKTQKFP